MRTAKGAVAVHCRSGLGRTGTLCALHLMLSHGFGAREACADLEMHKMKLLAEACTEENVNSTRVKLNHLQWRVMKIAPRVYGDKQVTQITGHDGGAVVINQTIDVRQLDADARDAFKQALLSAGRVIEHDPEEFEED
jgi:hypothetical protein